VSYYVILGGLQAMCMGLSNVSVQYLTYPTHILFKVKKKIKNQSASVPQKKQKKISFQYLCIPIQRLLKKCL
jgi:hypothetical protein